MSGRGILKYFCPITGQKDTPEDKDPPEGKELPSTSGHIYRRLYHRHALSNNPTIIYFLPVS